MTRTTNIQFTQEELSGLCSSTKWQNLMMNSMPFSCSQDLYEASYQSFSCLKEDDWLEAFSGHPMIGELAQLEEKFPSGARFSHQEQSCIKQENDDVLKKLLEQNLLYRERFGFIFIIFAAGKSAGDVLTNLNERLQNSRHEELRIAAKEQIKITHRRLEGSL